MIPKVAAILAVIVIGSLLWFYFPIHSQKQNSGVIVLYGNVDVRQVDLGFRVSGRVTEMPFQEGDLIRQGMLIAKLDNQPYADQVKQAEANVESSKANLQNAEQNLKRRKELRSIGDGSISQEDYDNAAASYNVQAANLKQTEAALGVVLTNLHDTEIYSPSDGVILTRIREPGTIVKQGDAVYTLSLSNPIWVRAFISEPELGEIYPGMSAEILTDSSNGKPYKGFVGFISPVAEFTPKTVETTKLRTDLVYRLRIIAENPDNGLRQGMPVTVHLHRT